jgi:hypothetical protein
MPDGRLTDMVNLTRAKDAAISLALGKLNGWRHEQRPDGASPIRYLREAAE